MLEWKHSIISIGKQRSSSTPQITGAGIFLGAVIVSLLLVSVVLFGNVSPVAWATSSPSSAQATSTQDGVEKNASGEAVDIDQRVLFVSSYDYDWPSTRMQIQGFRDGVGQDATVDHVFMNTKNMDYETTSRLTYLRIKAQMAQVDPYDCIVACDDDALTFVLDNRDDLFAGIPIVFDGINSEELAQSSQALPGITGVSESFPLGETLDLAQKLQPNATKVLAITDNSKSGKGSLAQFYDEDASFPGLTFSHIISDNMTQEELSNKLQNLDDSTIVIYLLMGHDADGRGYTVEQAAKMVSRASTQPVFKCDEAGIGQGFLGGYVISYTESGKQTGEITRKVLDGVDIDSLDMQAAKTEYLFDEKVMQRFGITKSMLPEESIYLNHQNTLWEEHSAVIIPMSVVIISLLLLVAVVLLRVRAKRLKLELDAAKEVHDTQVLFLSRMSHDMRTPMNGILGMTHMMEEQDNIDSIKKELPLLRQAGEYLLQLINDVLDIEKAEGGNITLHPAACNEQQLFEGIVAMIAPQAKAKGITFNFIKKDIQWQGMLLDAQRIRQIFFNLLDNAVKYTPEGGTIDFIMELVDQTDDVIRDKFVVRDSGVGMAPEFLPKVFNPFAREERVDEDLGGTGLGMAIVKSLVELMNGTITVESKLGEGTEFTLYLDLPLADKDGKVLGDVEALDVVLRNEYLSHTHILICEDNKMNAMIATGLLEQRGATVTCVENGQLGLDEFERKAPGTYDAILMDIRMPVMDGLEAACAIRASGKEDATIIPIIALSANAFEEDVQASISAGMNAHLPKPVDPETLYDTLYVHRKK